MKDRSLAPYSRNKFIYTETDDRPTVVERALKRALSFIQRRRCPSYRAVLTEQTVEYPLLFQHLDPGLCTILDFGCVEGLLPMQLCSLGYRVTGLDFRPYPFSHPNFSFVQADILTWDPPDGAFDAVISISTVEHVGLGAYGDPLASDGDRIAVQKLVRALKPGGKLYLTVPAGHPCIRRGMRIYDIEGLSDLMPPTIQVMRFFLKPHRYGAWRETSADEIASLVYEDYCCVSPVQGVAFVVVARQ